MRVVYSKVIVMLLVSITILQYITLELESSYFLRTDCKASINNLHCFEQKKH